jgi:hypothetical protein
MSGKPVGLSTVAAQKNNDMAPTLGCSAGHTDRKSSPLFAPQQQAQNDGRAWDRLIVQGDGQKLESSSADLIHENADGAHFKGYFWPYVEQYWKSSLTGSA